WPPSPRETSSQGLIPASGDQDHTPSPSASTRLVSARHPRPSHPAPTSVTIAIRPSLWDRTRELGPLICPTAQAVFSQQGGDDGKRIDAAAKLWLMAQAFGGSASTYGTRSGGFRSATTRTGGKTTQSTTSNRTVKLRSKDRAKAMASLLCASAMRGLPLSLAFSATSSGREPALQGLDLNLAEFDRSRAVLQRNRAFIEHSIPQFGRLVSVEHDRDVASLRRDFKRIPFAARLRHLIDFDIARNRACAVARIGALVKNVCFVAGPVGDPLGIKAAEIDAAVCIIARPEFDAQDKVLVRLLADEIAGLFAVHFVGHHRAVRQMPIGCADQ